MLCGKLYNLLDNGQVCENGDITLNTGAYYNKSNSEEYLRVLKSVS